MIWREVKAISGLERSSNIAYKVVKITIFIVLYMYKKFGVVQVLNTKIHLTREIKEGGGWNNLKKGVQVIIKIKKKTIIHAGKEKNELTLAHCGEHT